MRKNSLIILSSLVVLFLTACNGTSQHEKKDNEIDSGDQIHEQTGKDVTKPEEQKDDFVKPDKGEQEVQKEEEVTAQYRVSDDWSIVPIKEGINEKVVLLTIDDAPDRYALEMAKTLKELDANAIFFVNGHFIDTPEEAEILKQIYDLGFVIGNHTYNHVNLKNLEGDYTKQHEEIVGLNNRIEEIIGEKPKFFRAPHGINTDESRKIAEEEKMVLMNWSYGYDYFEAYTEKDKLIKAMVTGEGPEVDVPYSLLKNGANLLMHDREWTNEALKEIVIGLREKGYKILDPHLIQTIK